MATDSPTSATCGEHDICGVGVGFNVRAVDVHALITGDAAVARSVDRLGSCTRGALRLRGWLRARDAVRADAIWSLLPAARLRAPVGRAGLLNVYGCVGAVRLQYLLRNERGSVATEDIDSAVALSRAKTKVLSSIQKEARRAGCHCCYCCSTDLEAGARRTRSAGTAGAGLSRRRHRSTRPAAARTHYLAVLTRTLRWYLILAASERIRRGTVGTGIPHALEIACRNAVRLIRSRSGTVQGTSDIACGAVRRDVFSWSEI